MERGYNLKNEIGNRYGKLVAVDSAGRDRTGAARWLCQCDCGREVVVKGAALRKGHTGSCGCAKGSRLPPGVAEQRQVLVGYKRNARDYGRKWALSDDFALWLMQQSCYYCGEPPGNRSRSDSDTGDFLYNGIDRVDNEIDYFEDNVVACCRRCNFAKGKMSPDEFEQMAVSIYYNRFGI